MDRAEYAWMALLAASLSAALHADETFRCGGQLIAPGMTRAEVRALCGAPTREADEIQDVRSKGRLLGKTTIHRWTYENYSLVRVLVFDQDTLKSMMQDAGFEGCSYHNLSGGIVALHKGFRY